MSQSTSPMVVSPRLPQNSPPVRRISTTSATPTATHKRKPPNPQNRGKTVPVDIDTRIPAAYANKHALFSRAWWTEVSKGDRLWTDISKIAASTLNKRLKAVVPKIGVSVVMDAEERKQRNKEKKAERVIAQDEAGEAGEDAEDATVEEDEAPEVEEEEELPEEADEEAVKAFIETWDPAASKAEPIKTEPTALPAPSTPPIDPVPTPTAPKRKRTIAIKPEAMEAKAEEPDVDAKIKAEDVEPPKKMIKIDEGELAIIGGMAKKMNERDAKLRKEAIKVEDE